MPHERCSEVFRNPCALTLSNEPLTGGVEDGPMQLWMSLPEFCIALHNPVYTEVRKQPALPWKSGIGMVSLTSVSPSQAALLSSEFGVFGLGIDGKWAVDHGAHRVRYVERRQGEYQKVLEYLKAIAPTEIKGRNIADLLQDPKSAFLTRKTLEGSMVEVPFLEQHRKYFEHISVLRYWEYSDFCYEQEWRVVNAKPYAFMGKYSLSVQKKIILSCLSNPNIRANFEGVMMFKEYFEDVKKEGGIALGAGDALTLFAPTHVITTIVLPDYEKQFHHDLDEISFPRELRCSVGR